MIEAAAPGLHDVILLGAGIAMLYLAVAALQLLRLKRQHLLKRQKPVKVEPALAHHSQTLADQLRKSAAESDMQQLSREIRSLREILSAMRDEVRMLRSERIVASVATLTRKDAIPGAEIQHPSTGEKRDEHRYRAAA